MISKLRRRQLTASVPKIVADLVLLSLAYVLAFVARLDGLEAPYDRTLLVTLPVFVLLKLLVLAWVGSYRSIWRYSSLTDLERLFRGLLPSALIVMVGGFLLPQDLPLPRSIPFIDLALSLLFAGGFRVVVRVIHESSSGRLPRRAIALRLLGAVTPGSSARRALVVGAGDAGEMIVREMLRSARMDSVPVAFVDDDPNKHGKSIHGIPVLGDRSAIPGLVQSLHVNDILIAIPSIRGQLVRELVDVCRNTPASLKILPDLSRVVGGEVHVSDLRRVEVEDLLGREAAELNLTMISSYLRGKRILVTGAGGSIGSELCRQILRFAPAEIQLMGRGENSIYEIHREMERTAGVTRLVQVIGDVINKRKLEGVFAMYRPQIVFHAGADKHVPLMEMNPDEAVFNNIVGTLNVLEVANGCGVERVVSISTDKAVNPSSVMGCCKRVAELLVRSDLYARTVAVAVRFGNVLGSRGSVIPQFQRQIEKGGPVTVTSREIRRYFMTIPEAAGLVIQAGAMGRGGEIFVLDMGDPVRIWDLACNMIRLAGLEPGKEIEVKEVGLRPGEKMEEELFFAYERAEATPHPKILCVRTNEGVDTERLLREVKSLTEKALRMDFAGIRAGLRSLIPEYRPGEADDVFLETGSDR